MAKASEVTTRKRDEGDFADNSEKLAIAAEIIKGRERLGLTQAQLASASQVSLSAIKGYETGRSFPGARELKQISLVLRTSPNTLLFGGETPFTASDSDSATTVPTKGPRVVRQRVTLLLDMMAAEECEAIFALAYAITTNRFSVAEVHSRLEAADLLAGLKEISLGEPFDKDLFRMILKNPDTTKEFVGALRAAVAAADPTSSEPKSRKN